MGWAEIIAVDWGTTNRRAWRIADGGVEAEFEDGRGILSIEGEAFAPAVAEIRERLGNHPMLLAGMVGSNRGWAEAPYVPCPAGLDDLVGRLCWPEPGRTAIVPGLSSADPPDVMRGEKRTGLPSGHTQQMGTCRGRPDRAVPDGHDRRDVQPAQGA